MSTYTADQLRPGTRVLTPLGRGSVNWVRMAPPTFTTVEAASIWIEVYHERPGYSGTVLPVSQIALCTHNRMIERPEDPFHAWQCADCGYLYGRKEEQK